MKTITTLYVDAEIIIAMKKKGINISAAFCKWAKTQDLGKLALETQNLDGRLRKIKQRREINL